ncbi:unnamed protein product [Staurois parvus]|uniref:Cadherin domain-containing protein n=1 Tax=Staurois parvus TaxID=386267 RepID=A0ABN9A8N3_9NEOB|nr:unnamed protein product [Staurois parvus]
MEADTGNLMVTQPLDRERKEKYQLEVRAMSENGTPVEVPKTFVIKVIDVNDNQPFFTQIVSDGFVTEGSPKGTSVMAVAAKDLDDTLEGNNGVIRYSIVQQTPKEPSNAFVIAADNGIISANVEGLSQKHNPKFTLVVRAADKEGHGHAITRTVVITVGKADTPEMSGGSPKSADHTCPEYCAGDPG